MEKLVILTVLLLTGLSASLAAQCNTPEALSNPTFFQQDPFAKAALMAAADETITQHVDAKGNNYYVREYTNPWSRETGYHLLEFDPSIEEFVERQDYAYHGGHEDDPKGKQTHDCNKVKQDTLQEEEGKLLPAPLDIPEKQPRRSSRVKLASADF